MASATFTTKLKEKETLAEGTMGFYFAKPAGFQFKPGQYLDITLVDPPETDAEGNIRSLSIASAPEDEYLLVATRMRDSAFKRVLRTAALTLRSDWKARWVHSRCTIIRPSRRCFLQVESESRHFPASSATRRMPNFLTSYISFTPIGGQKMLLSCRSCKRWKKKTRTLNSFPA